MVNQLASVVIIVLYCIYCIVLTGTNTSAVTKYMYIFQPIMDVSVSFNSVHFSKCMHIDIMIKAALNNIIYSMLILITEHFSSS